MLQNSLVTICPTILQKTLNDTVHNRIPLQSSNFLLTPTILLFKHFLNRSILHRKTNLSSFYSPNNFLHEYYNILFFGLCSRVKPNHRTCFSVFGHGSDNRNENRGGSRRIDPDSGNEFRWTSIGNGGGHDVRPAIDSGLSNRVKSTDYPINSTARARSDSSRPLLPLLFICKSVKPL